MVLGISGSFSLHDVATAWIRVETTPSCDQIDALNHYVETNSLQSII